MKDIIKGVVYDRGQKQLNGETKYFTLVAMVIASNQPLASSKKEYIMMGAANITEELKQLTQYECPYNFGDISSAIVETSKLTPEDLDEL